MLRGLTFYVPANHLRDRVQVQWSETDILALLSRSQRKNNKKLHDKLVDVRAKAPEAHKLLWPTECFPSSFFKQKNALTVLKPSDSEDADDENPEELAYIAKSAVPTSVAISYLLWAIDNPKRQAQDRALAVQLLGQLLDSLLASAAVDDFELWIPLTGSREESVRRAVVQPDGRLLGGDVWTRVAYDACEQEWLGRQRLPASKLGVKSNPAHPLLLDLISFGLNPETSERCRAFVRPLALSILAQLAARLDLCAPGISEEDMSASRPDFKNKRKEKLAVLQRSCKAAMFILHKNVFWLVIKREANLLRSQAFGRATVTVANSWGMS